MRALVPWLTALAATGCIDTDAAVFVEATLGGASGTVTSGTLADSVSGSFVVDLHLGPRASGPGEVTLGGFSITSADESTTIVSSVAAVAVPAFPLSVPVDSDVHVDASFAAEDNLIDQAQLTSLCSGALAIKGVFNDSLRGGTISATSGPFTPAGCPPSQP